MKATRWLALPTLAFATLLGGERPAAADGVKIAAVDVQAAIMQTEDGIRAQTMLKKLFDKRQTDLDARLKDAQDAQGDIEKQQHVLSQAALQRRVQTWQQNMIGVQQLYGKHQKELQGRQEELTGPIFKKMMAIISKLAKKNGYEMIVDKRMVPYARPDLDLTEQVVQMYNSGDGADSGGDDAKKDEKKK